MANELTERIDIEKLDKATIDRLSNDVARGLAEIAREQPKGQFHLKLGHVKIAFRNSTHTEVIIGEPEPDDPQTPPPGGG
jgi:hypothetical protein